jgi:predicted amidohydrolase YtcJ
MAAASPVTTRALVFAALAAVALAAAPPATPATVYYGGDILTMTAPMGGTPIYPEALVERGGRIVYVGTKAQAIKEAGSGAIMKDLKGAALAPGFVDVHGHLLLTAHNELNAKLHDLKSMDEVLKVMKEHAKTVPAGAWIEGQVRRGSWRGRQ